MNFFSQELPNMYLCVCVCVSARTSWGLTKNSANDRQKMTTRCSQLINHKGKTTPERHHTSRTGRKCPVRSLDKRKQACAQDIEGGKDNLWKLFSSPKNTTWHKEMTWDTDKAFDASSVAPDVWSQSSSSWKQIDIAHQPDSLAGKVERYCLLLGFFFLSLLRSNRSREGHTCTQITHTQMSELCSQSPRFRQLKSSRQSVRVCEREREREKESNVEAVYSLPYFGCPSPSAAFTLPPASIASSHPETWSLVQYKTLSVRAFCKLPSVKLKAGAKFSITYSGFSLICWQ